MYNNNKCNSKYIKKYTWQVKIIVFVRQFTRHGG